MTAMREKYKRKGAFRQARDEILIVCGGQTERQYFEMFKQVFRPSLGSINVVTLLKPRSPIQIVEHAINERQKLIDRYNAVWCVFDKDEFKDFDDAISYAKANKIGAAYSNQAFEVWFINHFRLFKAPLNRSRYKEELQKFLTFDYDKSEKVVKKVCDVLLTEGKVQTAINNSRLGYERHKAENPTSKPSAFESCTTVFKLAQSLLNWAK